MVRDGRVAVNGQVSRDLPILIDPEQDAVTVDTEPVKIGGTKRKRVYILMNKPKTVVCTNVGQQTAVGPQRLAIDLLPPTFDRRVYPVGRLDADSTGLLLLTNDGPLTQKLTHPQFGVAKTYHVTCDGDVSEETLDALARGVFLTRDLRTGRVDRRGSPGKRTRGAQVEVLRRAQGRTVLAVRLKEGRNRQIRRMLAKVGHKVRDLRRVSFGPLELGDLKPAQSRLLTPAEVRQLKAATGEREAPNPQPEVTEAS